MERNRAWYSHHLYKSQLYRKFGEDGLKMLKKGVRRSQIPPNVKGSAQAKGTVIQLCVSPFRKTRYKRIVVCPSPIPIPLRLFFDAHHDGGQVVVLGGITDELVDFV